LDRRLVAASAQYHGHRVLKKEAQIRDVREIFEAAGRPSPVHNSLGSPGSNRPLKIELRPLRAADPLLSQFLQRMQLLQMERAVRFGFVDQFGLYWENAAHSLLTWVEDASLPKINDKRGSAVSGAWSLQKARKALDLRSDCRYSMVLAAAERLCPDFAEFVCKTSGR